MAQPPMAKLTMFMGSDEGYGWSENWVSNFPVTDLNALGGLINQFVTLRLAMMSNDTYINWVRLQSQYPRDPYIFDYAGKPNTTGMYPGNMNSPNDRVLVRLERFGAGFNRIFFGGIADSLVTHNDFTPDGIWQPAFDALKSFVINSGYLLVASNVDNPQDPFALSAGTQGFPKGILLTPKPPKTFVVGNKYRIKGSSIIGYNGVKTCVLGPPDTPAGTWLFGGAVPQQNVPITDTLTATLLQRTFGSPQFMFYEGLAQRKPGRPFGLRRGRGRTLFSLRPEILVGG